MDKLYFERSHGNIRSLHRIQTRNQNHFLCWIKKSIGSYSIYTISYMTSIWFHSSVIVIYVGIIPFPQNRPRFYNTFIEYFMGSNSFYPEKYFHFFNCSLNLFGLKLKFSWVLIKVHFPWSTTAIKCTRLTVT